MPSADRELTREFSSWQIDFRPGSPDAVTGYWRSPDGRSRRIVVGRSTAELLTRLREIGPDSRADQALPGRRGSVFPASMSRLHTTRSTRESFWLPASLKKFAGAAPNAGDLDFPAGKAEGGEAGKVGELHVGELHVGIGGHVSPPAAFHRAMSSRAAARWADMRAAVTGSITGRLIATSTALASMASLTSACRGAVASSRLAPAAPSFVSGGSAAMRMGAILAT